MAEASPTPEYKCLLCLKPYNQPRELPCNHTFCRSCLTSYIEREHRTADEDRQYFPCPVCDTPTSPSDLSTDVNTWGSSFPINHLFIDPTVNPSDDPNCEACDRVGESNPAVVWCTECSEMLCKQCKRFHERLKVSANHRLVTSKDGGFRNTTLNENCPKHEGRPLEVYCLDHSSMCCHTCVSVSHKHCNHIKPIDDVIKKCFIEQTASDTTWGNIKEDATKMLEDDQSEIALLKSKEKKVSVEMAQMIQHVRGKLDSLNITFQSKHADQCNVLRKQLSNRRNCVKKFHTNAENSSLLMTCIDKQGTDRQRFITREKTKNQMSGHYRRMDQNMRIQPNTFDLKLCIGNVIGDIMKLTSIAKVEVIPNISSTSQNMNACIGASLATLMSTPAATTFPDSTSMSYLFGSPTKGPATVDVWTGSVSCVVSVDCRSIGGRSTPRLTGGIFTDSGELLTMDMINSRLVLFDGNYCYKREYKVDGMSTDITRGVNTDEILIGLPEGVMRCTLQDDQLTVIKTINCSANVYGIAVFGENILVSTVRSVEIMSPEGIIQKSIKMNI